MSGFNNKRIFLICVAALLVVAAVISCALILRGETGREGEGSESSGLLIPPGYLLVHDIYEGERLVPEFDLPQNRYSLEKFQESDGVVTYQDGKAVLGVDVSEHQENIDWDQVSEAGVEFAMLRLGHRGYTEGLLYVDEAFEQNFEGATAAGLDVGVYFFSQAVTEEEAEKEAEFVLETLGSRELAYPVVFDWERPFPSEELSAEDLRAYACTGDEISRFAVAFCERIKKAGKTPMVYFNKTMAYDMLDLSLWKDYDFWYAEYQPAPSLYYHFRMWQFTDSATVPGIGTVDMNICFTPY